MAGIPWDKQGQCCLRQVGDFAGIPWGKQGQCCLTPRGRFCRYSLGYTRSVLSNTKWKFWSEILQLFTGYTRSVLSNAKWEILQVFPGGKQGQCCLTPRDFAGIPWGIKGQFV